MALLTGGSALTTTLRGLLVAGDNARSGAQIQNVAAFNALVKSQNAAANLEPTTFNTNGQLRLPGGRGTIIALPGDYIFVDPTSGWPIVVSAQAITGGGFVHS